MGRVGVELPLGGSSQDCTVGRRAELHFAIGWWSLDRDSREMSLFTLYLHGYFALLNVL